MATLHLPKKRPALRKVRKTRTEIDCELDEGLKQTFPASDPLAITIPSGLVTVEDSAEKKSDQTSCKDD
jgi:hypothetical protein